MAAPPAQFGTFHAAATSPAPPFVFTFVRSPGAHLASGLGQAALHFYGPLPCYAYGHKCMEGTARMKIARAGRKASEEVRRPESPWGGGPAPARVSSCVEINHETLKFSSSVKSKSIRLIFG